MVLLSVGLNTPSLRLRESNATLHSAKFNIDRDIPLMNNRPRKTLGWRTPAEAMADEIAAFRSTVALETGI
jgi:hypothetical protein